MNKNLVVSVTAKGEATVTQGTTAHPLTHVGDTSRFSKHSLEILGDNGVKLFAGCAYLPLTLKGAHTFPLTEAAELTAGGKRKFSFGNGGKDGEANGTFYVATASTPAPKQATAPARKAHKAAKAATAPTSGLSAAEKALLAKLLAKLAA